MMQIESFGYIFTYVKSNFFVSCQGAVVLIMDSTLKKERGYVSNIVNTVTGIPGLFAGHG